MPTSPPRTYDAPTHVVLSFLTGRVIPPAEPDGESPVAGMVAMCGFIAGSPVLDSTVLGSPDFFRPSLRALLPADLASLDAAAVPTPERSVALRDEVIEVHGPTVHLVLDADFEILPPN